jgi:FlaA1/EpsC-like NDP-sugar epimerase
MVSKFAIRTIIPSILIFVVLIASATLLHIFLQSGGYKWILRYLGIAGTFLIIISFIYSLRKRKVINFGKAKTLLLIHEALAWTGSLLILVHAGFDFNAVIPRMAVFAMLIVVASGITGKYLLRQARERIKNKRAELKLKNLSDDEIEKELFALSLIADKMQMWRSVHLPLTATFAALALLHIITTLLLWRW